MSDFKLTGKIYSVEEQLKFKVDILPDGEYLQVYRFYSLYNGARGTWWNNVKDAVEQGEAHQSIFDMIYNPKGIEKKVVEPELNDSAPAPPPEHDATVTCQFFG